MRTKWGFVLVGVGLLLFICFSATAEWLETTEYQITSSFLDETEPALGENIVVFTQIQPNGLGNIWYQPLANGAPSGTPVPVTNTYGIDEELVDVSGDYIVFTSTIDGIVVFRISDGASWSFGDPLLVNDPHIHGDWLVWLNAGEVLLYNLNDLGSAVLPQPISGIPAAMLEIGDRFAVWVESNDIVVWDLASATSTTVGSADSDISPVTSGAWVAWMASIGPTWIEAVNMDTNEHRVVVDNYCLNLRPSIHGDLIAWESNVAGNFDVWVYRLSSGESFQVTTQPNDNQLSNVHGNLVAYVDDRGLNKDVFISRLEFFPDDQAIPSEGVYADAFARHQDISEGPVVVIDSETAEAQAQLTANWDRAEGHAWARMPSDGGVGSFSFVETSTASSPDPIQEDIVAYSTTSQVTNYIASTDDPSVTTADIDVAMFIDGFLATEDYSGAPDIAGEVYAKVFFNGFGYRSSDVARVLVFEATARLDATTGLFTSGPWGGDFTPGASGWDVNYSGSFPAAFSVPTNETFAWEVRLGTAAYAVGPFELIATADFLNTGSSELSTSTPGVTLIADACPMDPLKTEPGICGCGIADEDTDGDGVADCIDDCPLDPFNDADGDGICGDEDPCPNSDQSPGVVIQGCDSGVANQLLNDGCTILDGIWGCAAAATNHGEFVSCVSHFTNGLKEDKIISGKEKGKIQSCAAKADIP